MSLVVEQIKSIIIIINVCRITKYKVDVGFRPKPHHNKKHNTPRLYGEVMYGMMCLNLFID